MVKIRVPSRQLTWQEALEIRKHALECAARTYQGQGAFNAENVTNRAAIFEDYLMGKNDG